MWYRNSDWWTKGDGRLWGQRFGHGGCRSLRLEFRFLDYNLLYGSLKLHFSLRKSPGELRDFVL